MKKFKGIFLGVFLILMSFIFISSSISNKNDAKEILKTTERATAVIKQRRDNGTKNILISFKNPKTQETSDIWVTEMVNSTAWEASPVNSEQPVLFKSGNVLTVYIESGVKHVATSSTQLFIGIGLLVLGFIGCAVGIKS